MLALMGPSGAGKTTLLRCINGLNRGGLSSDSKIYVNRDKQIYPCFIVQDIKQHLLQSLTVRQSILYASLLKNRGNHNNIENYDLINSKLITDLMLNNCIDTYVSKCSGGEQKRLVIAMELTKQIKPNLICIDEPTSGLDSNAAEQVLQNILLLNIIIII
jgi:polar amino acid transport system ATP-binding protein